MLEHGPSFACNHNGSLDLLAYPIPLASRQLVSGYLGCKDVLSLPILLQSHTACALTVYPGLSVKFERGAEPRRLRKQDGPRLCSYASTHGRGPSSKTTVGGTGQHIFP